MSNNSTLADKPTVTRRGFAQAMGAVSLATVVPVIAGGQAATALADAAKEEQDAAEGEAAPTQIANADLAWADAEGSPYLSIGQANSSFVHKHQDELMDMLRDYPVATEDLTLPDGTVIDKEHVTMYNRFNHMGEGLNGTPGVESFNLLQDMYTVEEARLWNSFPFLEKFTAADWAPTVGMTEDEATEILDDLAYRRRLDRYVRDEGVVYFAPAYSTTRCWSPQYPCSWPPSRRCSPPPCAAGPCAAGRPLRPASCSGPPNWRRRFSRRNPPRQRPSFWEWSRHLPKPGRRRCSCSSSSRASFACRPDRQASA